MSHELFLKLLPFAPKQCAHCSTTQSGSEILLSFVAAPVICSLIQAVNDDDVCPGAILMTVHLQSGAQLHIFNACVCVCLCVKVSQPSRHQVKAVEFFRARVWTF